MSDVVDFKNESAVELWLQSLPASGKLHLEVGREESPSFGRTTAMTHDMKYLADETVRVGTRVDVRPDVMERLVSAPRGRLESPFEEADARRLLKRAWERALADRPAAMGLSLSHTRGYRIAASRTVADTSHCASVGVDVEQMDRPADPRIATRISHARDSHDALPLLGVWTAKEAMLKADLTSFAKPLSHYSLAATAESEGQWSGSGTGPGGIRFDVLVITEGRAIISIALLK